MKKIILFRKDDFWGRGITIKVFIDNECYDLPNNTKIEVDCKNIDPVINAKYLWYASKKVILNSSDKIVNVRVKQIFTNIQLFVSFLAIILSFTLHQLYLDDIFRNGFYIVTLSFLLYIVFFSTIGSKNYFTFSINE